MKPKLDAIRECLEGVIPGTIATASPDGMPNVAYLSQVQFIDSAHIALSYQFFNKTRQNLMANPHAMLSLINPLSDAQYRLSIDYLRTDTADPLFASMKAKLAAIASHTGPAAATKHRASARKSRSATASSASLRWNARPSGSAT